MHANTERSLLWQIYKLAATKDTLIKPLLYAQDYGLHEEERAISGIIQGINAKIDALGREHPLQIQGAGASPLSIKNLIKALDAKEAVGV